MKNQSFLNSFILRPKSRRTYDVLVSEAPAVPDGINENTAATQDVNLTDRHNSDDVQVSPANDKPSNRFAMTKTPVLVVLTLVVAFTAWAGFQHYPSLPSRFSGRTVDTTNSAVAELVERADKHAARKQLESALVDLNTAIRLKPLEAKLYYRRALVHEQSGDYDVAMRDCEKVLDLSAGKAARDEPRQEAQELRIHCLEKVLKFDDLTWAQQLARLTNEIAVNPTAQRLNERAEIYEYLKRPSLALADLTQAAQLEPNNIDCLSRVALMQQDLGRYPDAIAEYSKIIEWPNRFDKDDACWALAARAQCYRRLKMFEWALADEQASDELRAVASGKIEFEKLLPVHYRQRHDDPLKHGIRIAVHALPNLLDVLPLQSRSGVTLAIDESIANPNEDQYDSKTAGDTKSLKAPTGKDKTNHSNQDGEMGLTDAALCKLSKSADCESLNLSCSAVTDTGLKFLAGKKIHRLDLSKSRITADGIRNLGPQPELTALSLDWNDCISDAVIGNLRQFPKLIFLSLRNTKVTDKGIKQLPETAPNLENLYLQGDDLGDDCIPAIAQLRSLIYLDLDHANIRGKTLEKLASLQALRYLDLSFEHSLEQRYLVQLLQHRPTLFELYLSQDEIDDHAAPLIASVKELRRIDLGSVGMTHLGVAVVAGNKTLRSIATGMFCDERDIAAVVARSKSINIGAGFVQSEDLWPKVIDAKVR